MNDIQKYRQATAEWIRNEIAKAYGTDPYNPYMWHPDSDANQQRMIEDELIKQGYFIDYFGRKGHYRYLIYKNKRNEGIIGVNNKSKFIAFRLAWMQFYETLEK